MGNIFDKKAELRQWLEIAEGDLKVAKFLANNMHPMPVEKICNDCQQSVEKDLKGFLFFNDIEPPKTHNLIDLLEMCSNILPSFSNYQKQCRYLTKFAVIPRYPNDLQLTDDDAKAAIRFAEDI